MGQFDAVAASLSRHGGVKPPLQQTDPNFGALLKRLETACPAKAKSCVFKDIPALKR